MKRWRMVSLVLLAAALLAAWGLADDQRTNVMVFQGRLTNATGAGRNGYKITFVNMYNGISGTCVTPFNSKIPGSFFLYLADLRNNAATMTGDQIVIEVRTADGRPLVRGRPMPYVFELGKGDAHACVKTMNVRLF